MIQELTKDTLMEKEKEKEKEVQCIRILLADDHAVFRCGLKSFLEQQSDFKIVGEVGTGQETIKAVQELEVDVLILDISMPGLPGTQAARILLQQKPGLAVVMLTMHNDEHYLQECFKSGVRAYLLKSSTGTDLIQAIRAAARGEQYIDSSLTSRIISSYVGRPASRAKTDPLQQLTTREREICTLLALGHTNAEIAEKLYISERTVETHRNNIMTKLSLKGRADLVRFAIESGLMSLG